MFDEQGRQIFRGQEALNRFAEALGSRLREAHKLHYKTTFQNLPISIENRKGSVRRGEDKDGEEWETKMKHPYGYIRGTEGPDGDAVDVFVGPNEDAAYAYVIHSNNPETGEFDEDKVMLGFNSSKRAKEVFLQHYDDPKFFGGIDSIPMWRFSEKVFIKKHTLKKLVASVRESSRSIPEGVGATGLDQSMKKAMLGRHQDQMVNPEVREAREPAFASLQVPEDMLEEMSGQAPPIRDASKGGIREGGPGSGRHKGIAKISKMEHDELESDNKPSAPKFLYHGTTSENLAKIQKQGLTGKVYVTTDPRIASDEAENAVEGDRFGSKQGAGGTPVILVIRADHPSMDHDDWKLDKEYSEGGQKTAFITNTSIGKGAFVGVLKSGDEVDEHYDKNFAPRYQKPSKESRGSFESRLGSFLTESRRSKGTYYARELARYDTDAEEADVDLIRESFGGRVDFPRTKRHGQLGMGYFHEKIDRAKRVVIKPTRGKKLTAGVFSEAKHAIKKGIPVYGIHKGRLRRVKNVEALGHPNKEGHFGRVIYRKRRH